MDLNLQYRTHQGLIMRAAASDCLQERARNLVLARACAVTISAYQHSERAAAAAGWARSSTQDLATAMSALEYAA